jgi:hypothetical protein
MLGIRVHRAQIKLNPSALTNSAAEVLRTVTSMPSSTW